MRRIPGAGDYNLSMRIFLTGATGYIGSALATRLARDGHEVRASVRETSDVTALREAGITTFEGDVRDRASLREGMSGADWVVHAAAVVDPQATEDMEDVNVGGSENVASLAWKLGVGRFLSVSSIAFFGGSAPDGAPATETSPIVRPLPSAYSRTKHEGELRIRAWAGRGLAVNTVYPSLVHGPPGKNTGANALLSAFLRGRFPLLVGGDRKTSWVFLDDVVDGIARVVERAEPARDYLLAGEIVTVRELVDTVCEIGSVEPPRRELSVRTARWLVGLAKPLLRLLGRDVPVDREQLDTLARHWAFDDARARRELGWSPRTLDEGLRATVDSLLARDRKREAA